MIVLMRSNATTRQISEVIAHIRAQGYDVHLSEGGERTIIGIVGNGSAIHPEQLSMMDGVEDVLKTSHPYKIASRHYHPEDSEIPLGNVVVGSQDLAIIAGPCSVEGRSPMLEIAHMLKEAGATALRGGAFKPRTSPYSFQGLGEEGLKILAEAREQTGLPIVTEVMDAALVPMVCEYADVLQIGARNMQNYALLHAVGESQHTVLLKRGMSSTIEELLMAAEYILSHGNMRVMLCERGIRTFETETRNTFDLNAVVALKQLTHLPVLADPSHATGKWEYVEGVALGAIAAGADGLLIEVHQEPEKAMSDGRQSLRPDHFAALVERVRHLAEVLNRRVPSTTSTHV
ncbi:MAG: 3-deoxy-7-phosphoheptulonate synthase [Phototrophicales bacterium]|nr:MAG: 3-deoxy-7-phosphoheptulonate synthase [Phototrophicales bacterium]